MKATELMIGDWVIFDPNVFNEDECKRYHEPYPYQIKTGECIDDAVNGCYDPIPLTAEIFEKNEFKEGTYSILDKGGYKSFPEYKYINREEITNTSKNLIKVSYSDKNGGVYDISFGIGSHIFDIKYVHELQHAMRLCGVKKEIKV